MQNNNKTILVTGCAGFIGSNFVPYFLNKYKNYKDNYIHITLSFSKKDIDLLNEIHE